jgi:outer membrane protein TolC
MMNWFYQRRISRALTALLLATPVTSLGQTADLHNIYTTQLNNLPAELEPVRQAIENVLSYTSQTDTTEGQWREAQATFNTQFYKWFPTMSADAKYLKSKDRTLENSREISSPSAAEQLQLGLTLRQNIFAAGADLKRQEVQNLVSIGSYLAHVSARKKVVRQWMRDVVQHDYYQDLIQLNKEAQKQAQQLNILAQRKEASGFLGRRDKLDSDREVLRTLQELERNKSALDRLKRNHLQDYGFAADSLGGVAPFEQLLKRASPYLKLFDPADVIQEHISKSHALSIAQIETAISEGRVSATTRSRLSPRIDLFAGLSERRELFNQQMKGGQANRSQGWQLGVSGELQVNPPQSFGSVEESRAQLATARLNETKVQRELSSVLANAFERIRQLYSEAETAKKLVAVTQTIRDQNRRLFEAGMISIDRLIVSQQDLDRDKKLLLSSQRDQTLLSIDLALSDLWQLTPSASDVGTSP